MDKKIKHFSWLLFALLCTQHIYLSKANTPVIISDDTVDNVNEDNEDIVSQNSTKLHYFVIFDAGSSGTRVLIYEFDKQPDNVLGYEYERVTKNKTRPGLSNYVSQPSRVKASIKELLEFAKQIPTTKYSSTWCILRATAGFRLLSSAARTQITKHVEEVLRKSPFRIPEQNAVKMISGQEEALYAWISVNIITKTFHNGHPTYPMLEAGGGSLQFAIETYTKTNNNDNVVTFKLQNNMEYHVHVDSYLGLGQSESVLKISDYNTNGDNNQTLRSECFAGNFKQNFSFGFVHAQLYGTEINNAQRYETCLEKSKTLLANLKVHTEEDLLALSNQPILCISGAYHVIKDLYKKFKNLNITYNKVKYPNIAKFNHKLYTLKVETLIKAAKTICNEVPSDGDYIPFYCVYTSVMTAFFKNGIKAKDTRELRAMGSNEAIGWTLGYSLEYLKKGPEQTSNSAAIATGALTVFYGVIALWFLLFVHVHNGSKS